MDVVPQLSAAWPGLTVTAKRRVVRVVAARAATDDHALALVAVATRDSDSEVARAALNALVQKLPRSQAFLITRRAIPAALVTKRRSRSRAQVVRAPCAIS